MVNSHYVPRLILRHFSDKERIQFCDIKRRKCERRNIKTVFSEKGYYSDDIEEELCHETEVKFAKILNEKLLKENNKVTFTSDELFIVKKYLLVTTLRYNISEQIKCEKSIPEDIKGNFINFYTKDFFDNLHKILKCQTKEELLKFIEWNFNEEEILKLAFSSGNNEKMNREFYRSNINKNQVWLFSEVKNIVHSYMVIVSTKNCKQDFIIPDVGYAWKASHLSLFSDTFDKCMYTLNKAIEMRDMRLFQLCNMMTPYDFILTPISKNRAILSLSPFFKCFNKNSQLYGVLPLDGLKTSELLGVGDCDLVEPPKVDYVSRNVANYHYNIKQLTSRDAKILNCLLINMSDACFGFYELEKVKDSLKLYNSKEFETKIHDLSFIY